MEKWLKETKESLSSALESTARGEIPKENMFKLAPIFYAQRHHINNSKQIQKMADANDGQVQADCELDENSINHYKFHYVSCYLFCFVVAGKIDEFKYDDIMEYVNNELELFEK